MRLTVPKVITPDDIVSINLTGSAIQEYQSSSTYNAGDVRKVSFEVDGSTPIVPVKEFKALKTTSLYPPDNSDPEDTGRDWDDLGAINRDRWTDNLIDTSSYADGTESTDPGKIVIVLKAGRQNKISLFLVEATKVTFEILDSSQTVIETEVYNLSTQVGNLEEYFYKPFDDYFDVIHSFVSLLVGTIRITLEHEDVGLYPGFGFGVLGEDVFAGIEINNPESGMKGYLSGDDFKSNGTGTAYANQETVNIDVRVATSELGKIQSIAAGLRDKATLYESMNNLYEPYTVLGILQDFRILYKNDRKSEILWQIGGIK